jgi:hypothetical protein
LGTGLRAGAAMVGVAALLAVVVTYATIFIQVTPKGLLGSAWYGYPVAWAFKAVVAPQYYPWTYDFRALGEDAVFWFVIIFVAAYLIVSYAKGGESPSGQKPTGSGT